MTENVSEKNRRLAAAVGLAGGARFMDQRLQGPMGATGAKIGSYARLTLIQRASAVIWGYSMGVWLYVIAMQLRYPDSVYWPLAVWLPIRLDYLGEAAFVLSFVFAMVTTKISATKRRVNDLIPAIRAAKARP